MLLQTIRKSGWILVIHLLFCIHMVRGQAYFVPDLRSGCAPLQVNFTNQTAGNHSYVWNLGNGNQPVTTNATANYSTPGTYIVTLTATSQSGVISNFIDTVIVFSKPTASFTVSQQSGCAGGTSFQFTNSSIGATTFIWDFGDGTSSTATNPVHVYAQPGIYCVKLIAESGAGCKDIYIQTNCIYIHALPVASISMNAGGSCDSTTVFQFNASGNGITSWLWNFGDGNTSTLQQTTHTYNSTGSFNVTLLATNTFGCVDTFYTNAPVSIGPTLQPVITATDTNGCAPFPVQFNCGMAGITAWNWNFGDGTTSTLPNPQHTFSNPGSYSVSLQITTTPGCSGTGTLTYPIVAEANPTVSITSLSDSGCAPMTVQFASISSGASQFAWDFGNGSTSTISNPTTTYTQSGSFNVSMTATSPAGCTASASLQPPIRVFSPKAFFTGSPLVGCPGMTVNFQHTAASTFITQYTWDFGDGTSGSGRNTSHTYTQTGVYAVTLIVTNSFGCKDTVIKNNYVTVLNPQSTIQSTDTLYVCEDLPAVFSDPGTANTSWNWDFGNGSTSTNPTDVTFYTQPGFYTVTLQTSMPGGCVQTYNPYAIVRVIPYDPQPIQFNHDNPCKPYTVSFSNNTPDVNAYTWDFGDGNTSSLANPVHSYQIAGTYVVTLTVLVGDGCVGSISTQITVGHQNPIQVSDNDVCTGVRINLSLANPLEFISSYWFFGDGTSSNGAAVFHNYTDTGAYAVTLITNDLNGCIDTFSYAPITVHNPVPLFSTVRDACINTSVHFNNQSLAADSYLWEFGDGQTSTGVNPSHTYTQAGSYTITLHATSGSCTVTRSWNAHIHIHAPESRFNFTGAGPCLPVTVSFNDQSSGAVSWTWEFGDGSGSSMQNPSHLYTAPPVDSIRLTITDAYGCSDITAIAPFPVYQAQAVVDDPTGCIPHQTQFTDQSGSGIGWHWDFGDGNYSTIQNPQHLYTSNGYYTVTLIVEFPGNCFDTVTYTDMVHVNTPIADFYAPNAAGCSPTQISFINTSSQASQFQWNFGDGNSSTLTDAQNIYYIPGTYTITLIATNSYGCVDSIVKTNYVSIPGTYTRFGISSTSVCVGEQVQFSDSSINASIYSWDLGDGPVSSQPQPVHAYNQAGQYTITLITWDSTGCSSAYTYPVPITVHPKPDALATASDSAFCTYEPVSFVNESQGGLYYAWTFGDGTGSSVDSPSHLFNQSGTYYPQLEVTSDMGCRDTFVFANPVTVLLTPNADFSLPIQQACPGTTIQVINSSTGLDAPNYSWDFGFTVSNQPQPTIFAQTGVYDASLIVLNSNGCSDTLRIADALEVYDTIAPPADPIATVTVIDNSSIQVIWLNSSATDLKSYRLYKLNSGANQWLPIFEDSLAVGSATSPTSSFTDTGLNTLQNTYSYKLQTIDECGYALPLDSLQTYTTINVSTVVNGTLVTVSWTPYAGCDFNNYTIYRRENAFSQAIPIATVPASVQSFTDTTIQCPFPYEYRIEAVDLCGRPYTSFSDTSVALPENLLEDQVVEIRRSTVVNNAGILTEWEAPVLAPDRVIEYQLMRSVNGGQFAYLASVPASIHSYLDEDVDVQSGEYQYIILAVNDCYMTGKESNEGSNIRIWGTWKDYKTTLRWNPYARWDAGVNHYRVEREESPGNWIFVGDAAPGTTVIEINE